LDAEDSQKQLQPFETHNEADFLKLFSWPGSAEAAK
jgi:hypothetical protein